MTASDGAGNDNFGFVFTLPGDRSTALVGAPYASYDATNNVNGPGAVYFFSHGNGT